MFPDGICRVTDTYYTKTIQFQDINYQLSQNEDKTAIFEGWCDFLNYFDASVHFQLTFLNMAANKDTYGTQITIPLRGDEDDAIRTEYTQMLRDQLAKGNNGLIKTKYLTFGIEADGMKTAKPRLERIETDVLNNFKRLGVAAEPLNGTDRLRLLHDMLRIDDPAPFRFSWDWLASSGLSVKDFIAPSSFEFAKGNYFGIGQKRGAVSFLQILAPELNDRMLADFLDMESSLIVTMHVQSVDQVSAIKTIKRKITDLDRMKIEEQKKAVRSGYDMDIIPSDLATYGAEAKKLLQELQSRNERMFLLTFLVLNIADSVPKLRNNVFQASSIAQKYNCQLVRLDFRQEEGLMSSLPLGLNQVEIQRSLTTSAVAIFVPFTTQELYQNGSEALYCGLNALSNNLIMVDRKFLKNPNGLILGTPGSGKSFAAKREIANVFFVTNDDIIICDPEAEYGPLVERLHGQVIKISPTSPHYINPMDLNLNYSDDENPLSLKSDFILSLCELIVGGKDGLQPVEKTIIDRCVRMVYRDYLNDPKPENMPVLEDLYQELRRQEEKEAQYVATALEIYVTGSLNVFNHRTNVDIQNRIVAFDIKELGKQLVAGRQFTDGADVVRGEDGSVQDRHLVFGLLGGLRKGIDGLGGGGHVGRAGHEGGLADEVFPDVGKACIRQGRTHEVVLGYVALGAAGGQGGTQVGELRHGDRGVVHDDQERGGVDAGGQVVNDDTLVRIHGVLNRFGLQFGDGSGVNRQTGAHGA